MGPIPSTTTFMISNIKTTETAPRASQRPAHCSAPTRLLSRRERSRISHRTRRVCCAAHARTAAPMIVIEVFARGCEPRWRPDPKPDRRIMSQTACERRHVLASMRWLHAGGDLSRHNHANQRADRPSAPNFPRLRALALFGRRPPGVRGASRHPGVQKPAQLRTKGRLRSLTTDGRNRREAVIQVATVDSMVGETLSVTKNVKANVKVCSQYM